MKEAQYDGAAAGSCDGALRGAPAAARRQKSERRGWHLVFVRSDWLPLARVA